MTKEQLQARIAELEEENEDQQRLDSIMDIATPEEEDSCGADDEEETTTKQREAGRLGSQAVAGTVGSAVGVASLMAASTAADLAWDQALGAALVGAMIGGADGWAFGVLRRTSALAILRDRAVARHEQSVRGLLEALHDKSAV